MLRLSVARRQAAAFAAVLALVLAQAVGLAHGLAHPQHDVGVAVAAAQDESGATGLQAAFEQHDEGSAECRLIDQAGHGDAASPAALAAWAFALPGFSAPAAPAAPRSSACARPYLARGPPSFLA
jgi:hypothetical protein